MKILKRLILVFVMVILAAMFWYFLAGQTKLSFFESTYSLEVKPGGTLLSVVNDLKEKHVIRKTFWFRVYSKLHPNTPIEAGNFVLNKGSRYKDLIKILRYADKETLSLTFLEGWSNREILDLLESKGFSRSNFEDCLKTCDFDYDFVTSDVKKHEYEGYLYPDTYQVALNESPQSLFDRMLQNFDKKTQSLRSQTTKFSDVVIKASLLEREVRTPEDKKIVAGILENRLRDGMRLDIDATVLYVLGDWDATLDYEKLQIDSPYNTRKVPGIPPSPICNPSLESIAAVVSPTYTNFYYYLNSLDGTTYFGENLEEHNRNKALYIR